MIPSLPKLLALAGVIWFVFQAFRMYENHKKQKAAQEGQNGAPNRRDDAANTGADRKKDGGSLDLEECSSCGAWVAGQPCDDERCPYRG